jgi:DNA-directed RNA polymerase specialized sigma24 family protein
MPELTADLVTRALSGDGAALRGVVDELTPVIQARAARVLLRRRAFAQGRDVRAWLADVTQDVFVELFRSEAKLLRAWDPARGMGLKGFVGLVAEQRTLATLRTRRQNPFNEALETGDELREDPSFAEDPEQALLSQEAATRLLDHVRAELSPLGLELFRRLLVEEQSIADVCAAMNMSTAAVQAWSSRLKKLVARLTREILAGPPSSRREGHP